ARFAAGRAAWRLAVVGDGEWRGELEAQAAALGITPRVHFTGVVEDPHPFYRAAGLFVLPSRVEGMSNALLEAMSHGLAPVVSDGAPGLTELVEDGVTGLVVPVDDPTALAEALGRLADDEGLRRRLGRAARARVEEYDVPRALAAWESALGMGG
ncbi:MAG TPA: glycosyltransferase, partial [Pyrinomonadaceae bacterium]